MKSEEYKNKLKETLKDMIRTLDNTYYSMGTELRKEILQYKENSVKIDKETNELYNILTKEKCEKLIKNKLSLRVKLFNKVDSHGKSIESTGWIRINFCLNDGDNYFSYDFNVSEIKELLNIKDSE